MKTKALSVLLVLAMLVGLLVVPAGAAEEDYGIAFLEEKNHTENDDIAEFGLYVKGNPISGGFGIVISVDSTKLDIVQFSSKEVYTITDSKGELGGEDGSSKFRGALAKNEDEDNYAEGIKLYGYKISEDRNLILIQGQLAAKQNFTELFRLFKVRFQVKTGQTLDKNSIVIASAAEADQMSMSDAAEVSDGVKEYGYNYTNGTASSMAAPEITYEGSDQEPSTPETPLTGINLSADKTAVTIDTAADQVITFTAGPVPAEAALGEVTYKLYDAATGGDEYVKQGVTLSGNKLTVSPAAAKILAATDHTVYVEAQSGTVKSGRVEITITRPASVATAVTVTPASGEAEVPADDTPATVSFTAAVTDQFGVDMTSGAAVTWSLTPADANVTVTDGVVTVAKGAAAGDYTVTAAVGEKSGTATLSVTKAGQKATTIELDKTTVSLTVDGETDKTDTVTATVKD
ncbi:MAG: hypothetical protein II794_05130, partial [Oscillospiraceae bacterium]|nr:hypothetical protein [Oscillospiraceae bacterium]